MKPTKVPGFIIFSYLSHVLAATLVKRNALVLGGRSGSGGYIGVILRKSSLPEVLAPAIKAIAILVVYKRLGIYSPQN